MVYAARIQKLYSKKFLKSKNEEREMMHNVTNSITISIIKTRS